MLGLHRGLNSVQSWLFIIMLWPAIRIVIRSTSHWIHAGKGGDNNASCFTLSASSKNHLCQFHVLNVQFYLFNFNTILFVCVNQRRLVWAGFVFFNFIFLAKHIDSRTIKCKGGQYFDFISNQCWRYTKNLFLWVFYTLLWALTALRYCTIYIAIMLMLVKCYDNKTV